jgi:hypothetical protein
VTPCSLVEICGISAVTYCLHAQALLSSILKMEIFLRNIHKFISDSRASNPKNDTFHRHLLNNLIDFANVKRTFVHIASLRRTGFYSRRERKCLQDQCLCDAHGLHEVQAERSRGTGWGRQNEGKCPNTPSQNSHPPVTHAHVHWDLSAAMLYEACDDVSLGEWCHRFAEMVEQVLTQIFKWERGNEIEVISYLLDF